MLFLAHAAAAQFVQQGNKLVGTGAVGTANQGWSVAISGDGETAIIGGPNDNMGAGAAWVFTLSGGVWTQNGTKLVGPFVGTAEQGVSVAISTDGNTAIVGGPGDNLSAGAAWVYTRSGGLWSHRASKLVGVDAAIPSDQGASVTISADGNTAIVGGPGDHASAGATWVFTRTTGVWSQQGAKLVGTGAVGAAEQGLSVGVSADGNTAIVGGPGDNSSTGAAWVFTRSGSAWSQQGAKLVGAGAVGGPSQGFSVAISADGNTAIVGGPNDAFSAPGAAWVFTRSASAWSQQGAKLVGADAVGFAQQGISVAISADGNTAIVGGDGDSSSAGGAAWVYTRNAAVWSQQGGKLVGTGNQATARQGSSVGISADGTTAIVGGPSDDSFVGAAWVFAADGCASPSITSEPQSQSIASGQTATLAVVATGTEPLSYRWYQGNAGDTSTPVGANASTFTTPPLGWTTSYWVWVFNACGAADSATATITVEPRVRRHLRRAM
jgi:hypothetical protein